MPRDIPVGNGSLLIEFDEYYQLREFYFPHVGQENHTTNHPFRFGVWVDGQFGWLSNEWKITKDYIDDALITRVELQNDRLQIRIFANDCVDFHKNIYLRRITVENLADKKREIRLFFCHDFHISGTSIGDTAEYRPDVRGVLHYKADRYFLINVGDCEECGVHQYACGEKERSGKEGTWKDAEDGVLSNNPISQGSVDSVISLHDFLEAGAKRECYYWICAGKNWNEVKELNEKVIEKTPEGIFDRTLGYWRLWCNKEELNYDLLPEKVRRLYKRSLPILRTQIDNGGAIIAANDSDNVEFNKDTYSYMWPRDASFIAYALDLCNYSELTRRFFYFAADLIEKDGYFLHKYTPSGSLASSWHPWIRDDEYQLPIQEDETALVVWALWHHFIEFRDIEFIKLLYNRLVKKPANFMLNYRDHKTKLPLPSYDLWEEHRGVFTYTAATVYGGLTAAAKFSEAFGEMDLSRTYQQAAEEIKEAIGKYLYLEDEKRFAKRVMFKKDGEIVVDQTVDASTFAVFYFGVFDPDDERVKNNMEQIKEKLYCKTAIGGVARYENDGYHRRSNDVPGNPWFITTLWMAQYYIALATSEEDLVPAMEILEWAADRAMPSGVMSEQLHPYTGEPISVSPLTWSHGTYLTVVQEYINKLVEFKKPEAQVCKYVEVKNDGK